MEIREIYIKTLERTKYRLCGAIGALDAMGAHHSIIHPIYGKDWRDYEDFDALRAAVDADGYEWYRRRNIGGLACQWSGLRVLDRIRQRERTILVMEDDFRLTLSLEKINELLALLPHKAEVAIFRSRDKNLNIDRFPRYNKGWIQGGGVQTESVILYTPKGAQICLDFSKSNALPSIEMMMLRLQDHPNVFMSVMELCKPHMLSGESSIRPGTGHNYDKLAEWGLKNE